MTIWTDSFEIGAMELKREYVMTAIISAVVGAGLMLLAVGGSRPAGIEGWAPLNREVAAVMGGNGVAEAAPVTVSAEGPGIAATQNDSAVNNESAAITIEPMMGQDATDSEGQKHELDAQASTASAGTAGGNEAAESSQPASERSEQDGLVSLNTANSKQLQTIPGIGEKKAQAILDYRNQHGSFKSLSDLKKVKGIGDKMFQKMKPYIKL
ncbi:ComEA family DNA-binding protein [Paenibacillus lentus]|uniref:Helix-hairpin-helix domain-containing protein n=1 Tax=Paenibacillus lentus TaxID=1338368 RepID=A0A3S8RVI4_9BACL|nr:helix-hairpin-helix domain-containing protein [Paenibacillus lentus]AZK46793.1 helix-hairpin-helix domain-containing protein [Paenibacillus lentus]